MNLFILAFGFANVAILGWLAAAAAPILIHLWMKRVHRETPWAAVRFLQAAIKRHSRRLKIQEWLLLAIRTAIILLIVLAASKPLLDSLGLVGPGVRTHRLLVMDASLSMGYQSDQNGDQNVDVGTLLDRAKQLADELIDQSRSGDVYSLLVMTSPPQAVLRLPTSDRSRARGAVAAIERTDAAASLEPTLRLAQQMIEQAKRETRRVDRHEVVFFSDLARNTWGALATAGEPRDESSDTATIPTGESHRLFESLTDLAGVSVVDLGVPNAANGAVTQVNVAETLPTLNQPVRISADLQQFGQAEDVPSEVELIVDGVTVGTQKASLAAERATTIDFVHRFSRPGVHAVQVRLADDNLPADNSGWLGLNLAPHIRVLCVAGGPDAARYVADALNPGGSPEAAIQPLVISDAELATVDLADFDCVFFCNVAQWTDDEALRIENYLRGGGGAVFFLGDRVLPDRYNRVLGAGANNGELGKRKSTSPFRFVANRKQQAILPVTIGQSVATSSYGLDPLDYAHPIVKPFRGRERAGLLTSPVAKYWQLTIPPSQTKAAVALATLSGDPLVVTAPVFRGRVTVVATAASLASIDPATNQPWTVMPAWPSWLPIVRELLNDSVGSGDSREAVLVGEPLSGANSSSEGLNIIRPDERSVAATLAGSRWEYENTDRAGIYKLQAESQLDPLDAIAVSVDPAESNLARVPTSALPAGLQVRRVATSDAGGASELTAPTGIHRGLLLAALGLVLLETLLAYWFGRPAS